MRKLIDLVSGDIRGISGEKIAGLSLGRGGPKRETGNDGLNANMFGIWVDLEAMWLVQLLQFLCEVRGNSVPGGK